MEWLFMIIAICAPLAIFCPVAYSEGKKDGFQLGRQEPTEITVVKEIPGPVRVIEKEVEVVKVVTKEIPMTPKICQCGHGICYHLLGSVSSYRRDIDGSCGYGSSKSGERCFCQRYTEV